MAAKPFQLQGLEQFAKNLRSLDLSKQRAVKVKILMEAAEPIQETAERLVPVSDEAPHLVDHILRKPLTRVDDEEFGGKRSTFEGEAVVGVGPVKSLFYGSFQEFGTVRHKAQPFMRPAWDQHKDGAYRTIQARLWDWIRSHAGGGSTSGRNL